MQICVFMLNTPRLHYIRASQQRPEVRVTLQVRSGLQMCKPTQCRRQQLDIHGFLACDSLLCVEPNACCNKIQPRWG